MIRKIKLFFPLLSLLSGLFIGWFVNSWYQDSVTLAINAQSENMRKQTELLAAQSARLLETRLQELRANETRIEHHYNKEIIKPVFNNICVSDEFMRLFNENTERVTRTLSGESFNAVPYKPP